MFKFSIIAFFSVADSFATCSKIIRAARKVWAVAMGLGAVADAQTEENTHAQNPRFGGQIIAQRVLVLMIPFFTLLVAWRLAPGRQLPPPKKIKIVSL